MQTLCNAGRARPGRAVSALLLALCCALATPGTRGDTGAADEERRRIDALLNDFHAAAAEADRDRYLGHFAPNGVFMGTDDWERWPLAVFTAYVTERFENGGGWSYASEQRHVDFAPGGDTAWFDEIMLSRRWGRFRGTGVLLRLHGEWKLAHYSLTALVPNEHFEAVSKIATAGFETRRINAEKESEKEKEH